MSKYGLFFSGLGPVRFGNLPFPPGLPGPPGPEGIPPPLPPLGPSSPPSGGFYPYLYSASYWAYLAFYSSVNSGSSYTYPPLIISNAL